MVRRGSDNGKVRREGRGGGKGGAQYEVLSIRPCFFLFGRVGAMFAAMCGAVFSFGATNHPKGAVTLMTVAGVPWALRAVCYGVAEKVCLINCLSWLFSYARLLRILEG